MAKAVQRKSSNQPQAEEKLQRMEIVLGPARDIPIQWANRVVVIFLGTQFFVNIVAAAPEPWMGMPKTLPNKVDGKVLARYAFSVPEWAAAVDSFAKQIERLQAEGAFGLEIIEEAK